MAKITVNRENFKVEERELEQGTLKIGRNADNQLHIDDLAVSNHHAQIVTVFDSTYVEDLDSTNGTFVNGQKIKTHTLHNGDVITIGHYQILFQSNKAASAIGTGTDDPDVTMMIGVSQLEELTKKAQQKNIRPTPQKIPSQPVRQAAATPTHQATPAGNKPKFTVHESGAPINSENTKLPDVDERTPLLSQTQRMQPSPHMQRRRKSDLSPVPSLKVIVLAVLATVATFMLLMLFFK
jgi:predicted component of type VI protein secretion system